jgi:hypothetical protein
VDGYAGEVAGADAGTDALPDALVIDSGLSCSDVSACDDDEPCTADSCWGGTCLHTPLAGTSCADGNVCNGDETCDATGTCEPGAAPNLDDDNDCTVDFCDPVDGVKHQLGDYPPSKSCNPYTCATSYYRSKALLCDPACGTNNCGFCINGFLCERACTKSVTACCVGAEGCASSCPTGYEMVGQTCADACGCGGCGAAAICER